MRSADELMLSNLTYLDDRDDEYRAATDELSRCAPEDGAGWVFFDCWQERVARYEPGWWIPA